MGKTAVNRSALRSFAGSQVEPPTDNNSPLVLLDEMAQALGQHFDVPLPVPELLRRDQPVNIKEGKEFSVGLLENPGCHEWASEGYRRLRLKDRVTIAGSLFLWRKTLPSVPSPQSAHRARVTAPEIVLPPGYVAHLVRTVEECFPVGWDHGYLRAVEAAVPTTKSVIEKSRGKGGYRSERPCRFEFGRACMGETRMTDAGRVVKYMDAQCDGKSRAVTVMTAEAQRLKPLHKIIYDQISKYPWLLRGEAKPSVFRRFRKVPGEVFVSGDYEAATDHLPVSSAEWILRAIFRRCRSVPLEVQADAIRYLRVTIEYDDCSVQATRQLMGSLLCFPLLCLQNYCAFRWVFGPLVPVKVNGDDIVFRCSREEYERWAAFVGSTGLKLSPGKTLVSSSVFSLNSTFFHATKDAVKLIPVIRCSSLVPGKCPYPGSLAGSFARFLKGFSGELRDTLGAWFLRRKGGLIRKSGRSVVRGLGMAATDRMLKASGLWLRDVWYVNSVPSRFLSIGVEEEGEPLPLTPERVTGQVDLPSGWKPLPLPIDKRKAREALLAERDFWEEVTDRAWTSGFDPRKLERQFWLAVSRGGFENQYRAWRDLHKPGAVHPLVKKLMGVRVRSRLPSKPLYRVINQDKRKRVKRVWQRVEEEFEERTVAERAVELVARKIALPSFSVLDKPDLLPIYRGVWVDRELALDRYIQ
jgi:hypothetical protein